MSVDRQISPFLNQIELSRRWKISPRTLERWRYSQMGPPSGRIGGRVLYKISDIEAYEAAGFIDSVSEVAQ
jgi:hypothetical protein